MTWKKANKTCIENHGGNLTEIQTQETNTFVSLLTRSGNNQRLKPAWTGLKYDITSSKFNFSLITEHNSVTSTVLHLKQTFGAHACRSTQNLYGLVTRSLYSRLGP